MSDPYSPYPISPLHDLEGVQWLAADLETFPIGPNAVIPEPIVVAVHSTDNDLLGNAVIGLDEFTELSELWCDPPEGVVSLAHNAAFDLKVTAKKCPTLIPYIFRGLREGRIQCTIVREKLLNLAESGNLNYARMPDGTNMNIQYNLAALEKRYMGLDRKADKESDSSWRVRYQELAGISFERWPLDALDYVIQDVRSLPIIANLQEQRRAAIIQNMGVDPWGANGDMAVLRHRCLLDFVLALVGAEGIRPDPERIEALEQELEQELNEEAISLLIEHGIVVPAKPAMPYANGVKDKEGNPKMKRAVPEKTNKKVLQAYILKKSEEIPDLEVVYSTKMRKKLEAEGKPITGAIKCNKDWMVDNAGLDPVLSQFEHRQSLQKLVTTELPRMKWNDKPAHRIYTNYDQPKETGRTSARSDSLYPSFNAQNVHRKVRDCFIPDEGWAFFSIDYEGMELGTLAQVCLDLYGFSKHADLINGGVNIHTYLGAQLAYFLDPDFRTVCEEAEINTPMAIYEVFKDMAHHEDADVRKFFKRYRTFAKPTDLGYPGGLREKTFIVYAKATYGVDLIEIAGSYDGAKELATKLRNIYLSTFSEMPMYFADWESDKWRDWSAGGEREIEDKETGEKRSIKCYQYTTAMGMHRANCTYNAGANGKGLQSPSADGATMALCDVVEEVWNHALGSILYQGPKIQAFIHDEIFGSVPWDDTEETAKKSTAMIARIEELMVNAMMRITPDVQSRVDSCLMLRWDKGAERATADTEDGQEILIPWEYAQ